MPALPMAVTPSVPVPLKISCASLKKAAFSSSPSGVSVYFLPSASWFVPLTTTNVRFLFWLLMAAPLGFVRSSPFSTMACFFSP